MKKVAALSIFFLVASCFAGESSKEKTPAKVVVHDSFSSIWVQSTAPFPPEITNDSQAHALCRDAAIAIGQDHLLAHVLDMKTKS